jgi:hypothetical protein
MYNIKLKSFKTLLVCMAAGLVVFAGCVKDEDFDNHVYGITNPAEQPKGVLFQQSRTSADGQIQATISSINSTSEPQTVETVVKIAADQAVSSDLHVTVTLNNDLLNGTDLVALDAQYYTTSLDLVIPKGEKYTSLVINIPDATAIDPGNVYGLGFTISTVDAGYTIAENSKNMVVGIAIKNQWDGTYDATGYVYHPSAPRAYTEVKDLKTVSANSVSCFWGDLGPSGYVALLTIDPATNKVSISDYTTGIPIVGFDTGLPTTNPGYTPKWDGSSECNNTYDPATKTFYLRMGYMGGTGWRVDEEILVAR